MSRLNEFSFQCSGGATYYSCQGEAVSRPCWVPVLSLSFYFDLAPQTRLQASSLCASSTLDTLCTPVCARSHKAHTHTLSTQHQTHTHTHTHTHTLCLRPISLSSPPSPFLAPPAHLRELAGLVDLLLLQRHPARGVHRRRRVGGERSRRANERSGEESGVERHCEEKERERAGEKNRGRERERETEATVLFYSSRSLSLYCSRGYRHRAEKKRY